MRQSFGRPEDASGAAAPGLESAQAEGSAAASLKGQAADLVTEASAVAAALAEEAQARLRGLAEQQKTASADRVAEVARAAQAAAHDLKKSSPYLAQLVKSAADRVDRFGGTIRASDVSDVLASVSAFGRRQPLALFGGALATGFLLGRFLKSGSAGLGHPGLDGHE